MGVQPDIRTRQVNPFAQTCQGGCEDLVTGGAQQGRDLPPLPAARPTTVNEDKCCRVVVSCADPSLLLGHVSRIKVGAAQRHDGRFVEQLEAVPRRKVPAVVIPAIAEDLLLADARWNGRQRGRIKLIGDGLPQRMPHQRAVDPGTPDFGVGFDPQDADDLPVLDRQPEAFFNWQRELAQGTRDVGGGRVEEADVVFGVAVEAGDERDHGCEVCPIAAGDNRLECGQGGFQSVNAVGPVAQDN